MISHKHKFIFVEVPKTGSTSLRKVLQNKWGSKTNTPHTPICNYNKEEILRYFKFSLVRNPWDRLISLYHRWAANSNVGSGRHPSLNPKNKKLFREFIEWVMNAHGASSSTFQKILKHTPKNLQPALRAVTLSQFDYLCDKKGRMIMDYVGRFENLEEHTHLIFKQLGKAHLSLPHLNKPTQRSLYTEYYDKDTEEIVRSLYAKDVEYFGYEFGKRE